MRDDFHAGISLMIVGGVLLLHNLGFLHWSELFRLWPLALIAAGVSQLLSREVNS